MQKEAETKNIILDKGLGVVDRMRTNSHLKFYTQVEDPERYYVVSNFLDSLEDEIRAEFLSHRNLRGINLRLPLGDDVVLNFITGNLDRQKKMPKNFDEIWSDSYALTKIPGVFIQYCSQEGKQEFRLVGTDYLKKD